MEWGELKEIQKQIAFYYTGVGKQKSITKPVNQEAVRQLWLKFCVLANKPDNGHGPFLQILKLLDRQTKNSRKSDLAILDHGCNQAFTLMYLAARGYTNIFGVDLEGSQCSKLNGFSQHILGVNGKRFQDFDGDVIPLEAQSVDVVISQTVVEHVVPELLHNYFLQEARVLKYGGVAYHDVPVRLNLYDSHTRLWLLHYLPRPFWVALVGLLRGPDLKAWSRQYLFLRSGSRLKRMAADTFGKVEDITFNRLIDAKTAEHFVGIERLRRRREAFNKVFALPILGRIVAKCLVPFVMMTTVSTKVHPKSNLSDMEKTS